ncbi:sialic acid TRAP transporter substrate-binding protein SiaP [Cupriavidus pauculus]|uniref:sialic acid TRAP transporter substrate-binding protein SiaP n=1 Tax=Cupriavidus pauculus TaxID=82633 RepID=UPI000A66B145
MMRIRRQFSCMLGAGMLLAATAFCTPVLAQQAPIKLKWAHVYETSEPFHKWSVWAADEIKKRSNGKYQIDVFPASQLGKENDINQGLAMGTVDIIISGSSFAAKSFPRIGVTYYPYTFRDPAHLLAYTKSDIYRELTTGYEQKTGNHIVATTYYGTRQSTSNKPFSHCAEMKGLKMRVPDVPAYLAMPRACGVNTSPIAFAEVYLALQNGTVEAQENPLTTIEAKKFYEVQKYIVLTGHIVDHLNTVISGSLWKRLSEPERKMFGEVAQEAAARASADVEAREKELVAVFKQKGLTVTPVSVPEYRDAVLKNVSFESQGYRQADWEKIQAVR